MQSSAVILEVWYCKQMYEYLQMKLQASGYAMPTLATRKHSNLT